MVFCETPNTVVEFKSYKDVINIPLNQFKNYLSSVTDLRQMKYVFNASKFAAGTTAKDGMKRFLKANAETIWKIGDPKGLFKNLKLKNGDDVLDADTFETYLSEISSNNSLFDFVVQI